MGPGERPRARTLWMGALVVAVVVVLSVGFLLIPEMQPPTVTCSTPDTATCTHTRNWISDHWGQDWVFSEPLPAHLVAVDVRPTPPEWKQHAALPRRRLGRAAHAGRARARAGRVLLQFRRHGRLREPLNRGRGDGMGHHAYLAIKRAIWSGSSPGA